MTGLKLPTDQIDMETHGTVQTNSSENYAEISCLLCLNEVGLNWPTPWNPYTGRVAQGSPNYWQGPSHKMGGHIGPTVSFLLGILDIPATTSFLYFNCFKDFNYDAQIQIQTSTWI